MKQNKFSEGKILQILKEYESGIRAKELGRKYGFHFQTLYDWKKRFSGIESVSELQRIKELEAENAKLKKMYAERSIEIEAMKEVLSKKW